MKLKDVISEDNLNNIKNIINIISNIKKEMNSKMQIPLKSLENFIIENQTVFQNINFVLNNLSQKINIVLNNPGMLKFFSNIKTIIDNYPEAVRQDILNLANFGWFLDFKRIDISDVLIFVKYLEDGEINTIDQKICEEYKKYLDDIIKDIINRYPKRKLIIEKAFNAHKKVDYELSIPTLFTQIDGICQEEIGKEFFLSSKDKKNNKILVPKTADFFSDYKFNSIIDSLLEPLKVKTAINYSGNERKKLNYITINRHEVLHGESTTYATEINSYKVISLLSYINSIFSEVNIKGK